MKYPIIELDKARDWWFAWRAECERLGKRIAPPKFSGNEYVECQGTAAPEDEMVELVRELSDLFGAVDGDERELDTNRFEAKAAELMHGGLSECEALADPRFWIWSSVAVGAELISRRYPFKPEDGGSVTEDVSDTRGESEPSGKKPRPLVPGKENFFSASARETLFYRLWIRGRLGYVEDMKDPYKLARCGDVDFWRSHIFRQMSLESENLRIEFIRFQFPDGPEGKPRLSQSKIRSLIKRLRRAAANVVVDGFDREDAEAFILRQWKSMNA